MIGTIYSTCQSKITKKGEKTYTRFHSDPSGLNDQGVLGLFHFESRGLLPQKVNANNFHGGLGKKIQRD